MYRRVRHTEWSSSSVVDHLAQLPTELPGRMIIPVEGLCKRQCKSSNRYYIGHLYRAVIGII